MKQPCNAEKLQESMEKARESWKNYRKRQLETAETAENYKNKIAQKNAEYRKRKKLEEMPGYNQNAD